MKITELCTIRAGKSFSKKPVHDKAGDYWVLESFCLDGKGRIIPEKLVRCSSAKEQPPRKALEDNEILIRAKGTTFQAIHFNQETCPYPTYATSYFLIMALHKKELTSPEFLTWQINQPKYQKQLSALAGGATVKHLTKSRISELDIDIPSFQRQQCILALEELIQEEEMLERDISLLRESYYQKVIDEYLGDRK